VWISYRDSNFDLSISNLTALFQHEPTVSPAVYLSALLGPSRNVKATELNAELKYSTASPSMQTSLHNTCAGEVADA
jgi:hypothetical protein